MTAFGRKQLLDWMYAQRLIEVATQSGRSAKQERASVVWLHRTDLGINSEISRHHMATWIWKDHPISLRVAVVAMSFLFLLGTMAQLLNWYEYPGSWVEPLLAFLFAVASYGMLRMASWARWVTVVFLWVLIFLVVGIINPYLAGDWMSAGIKPPSVATLLAYIIPAEAAIIWVLHILGKYKRRFE